MWPVVLGWALTTEVRLSRIMPVRSDAIYYTYAVEAFFIFWFLFFLLGLATLTGRLV